MELNELWRRANSRWLSLKPKVHFLHISKTGGTAIAHAIRHHLTAGKYNIRVRTHDVSLADIPAGEKVFFFLRDPITRFVSAFYSRQREGRPRYETPWSPEEAEAFARFSTPCQLASALSSSSDDERRQAIAAMRNIRLLSSHYVDWLIDENTLLSRLPDILFAGFQESLDADFEQLKRLLDLPRELTLPRDSVQAHRNPPGLDTQLSAQATANLKEWLRADYECLALVRKCIVDGRLNGGFFDNNEQ